MPSRFRPSPTTAIAVIALFVSLGGVGWAALSKNSVKSKQIKDGAVKSIDVKDNAVTGTDVDEASLGKVAQAARADTAAQADTAVEAEHAAQADQAAPTGAAAGALSGSYPNPALAAGVVGTSNFSASIPAVRVERTSAQTFASSAALTNPINFDAERFDTAAMHDNATNNNRLVAPVTGVYAITASVEWQGNATGIRSLGIRPNNGDVLALDDRVGATGGGGQSIDTIARLNAGDFVDVVAAQTSGGPLDIANIDPRSPEFSMVWIAPG